MFELGGAPITIFIFAMVSKVSKISIKVNVKI